MADGTIGDVLMPEKRKADVRAMQEALAKKGFNPGSIDGIVGPKTREAIAAFEKASGLPNDGVVDDAMLKQLGLA